MHRRYTILKTSLDVTQAEKINVEDLLAAAELQNIALHDRVQDLKEVESKMLEWKTTKSQEINEQLSSIMALKR